MRESTTFAPRDTDTKNAVNQPSYQPPNFSFSVSRLFPAWMEEVGASLAISTYELGSLVTVGVVDHHCSFYERRVARCMGIAASPQRLWIGTMVQLWAFVDCLEETSPERTQVDRLYYPRLAYVTGDIDIHDVAVGRDGRPVFVNTLYSCLARPSDTYNFEPVWKPSFISRLAAEDRCHLNGLAMEDGEPAYVTCVARSDVAGGWRDFRADGGMVIDVRSNDIVCAGLSMPHSPRLHDGRLWLLNSGTGELGYIDRQAGRFEPVTFCPGYLRGLSLIGHYAVVGLSAAREGRFGGLPLDERLKERGALARCAVQVIDLRNGDIVHELRAQGELRELYDVAVIPGVASPGLIGFGNEELPRRIVVAPNAL